MKESDRLFCLGVTDKLMARPAGTAFCGKFSKCEIDRTRPTWYLTDVKAKLLQNAYKTKADWRHDIETIWKTARQYEKHNSYLMDLVEELESYFIKLTGVAQPIRSLKEWSTQVKAAADVLNHSLGRLPRRSPVTSLTLVSLPPLAPLTPTIAQHVLEAASELPTPQDAQAMFTAMQEFQPDLALSSPYLTIAINELSPLAQWSLEGVVRRKCRDLGKPFPEEESSLASD
jgi:hypothetical protein